MPTGWRTSLFPAGRPGGPNDTQTIRIGAYVGRRTGYVGPELTHASWGRAGRIIAFVREFYPTWDEKYCQQLMETFGLHPDARVMTLSCGARIKLSLVLALA